MSGFLWNDVITQVATLGATDADLIERGITTVSIQPLLGQNCKTPILFPSRNPTVNVQGVTRFSFGGATNGGRRHKGTTTYTLDWIYLHIENTQQLNAREHEAAIRDNRAAIFRAITRRDRTLGIGRVLPQSAEIDYNLQDPTSGRQYLGAHIVLLCNEIIEL